GNVLQALPVPGKGRVLARAVGDDEVVHAQLLCCAGENTPAGFTPPGGGARSAAGMFRPTARGPVWQGPRGVQANSQWAPSALVRNPRRSRRALPVRRGEFGPSFYTRLHPPSGPERSARCRCKTKNPGFSGVLGYLLY